jgi:hypothetical protein
MYSPGGLCCPGNHATGNVIARCRLVWSRLNQFFKERGAKVKTKILLKNIAAL